MDRAVLDAVFRKKLIFTVTAGRTGTKYLAELLATIPDATALHEPDPSYRQLMRAVVQDPGIARAFFLQLKFKFMAAAPGAIYAETSHMFCKGFLVPLLQIGLRPCLVFLRRSPRDVALSYLERDTVPARTSLGNAYVLRPDDSNVLQIPGWEQLTDYQLCFWYALAMELRQWRYAEFARKLELSYFDTTAAELNSYRQFAAMLDTFRIPHGTQLRGEHAKISATRHNPNKLRFVPPADLDRQEEQVWDRVGAAEPMLRHVVTARYNAAPYDEKIARIRAA
jgi:hypothetical protein